MAPPMGIGDLMAAFDRLGSARTVSPSAGRSIPSDEASPVGLGHGQPACHYRPIAEPRRSETVDDRRDKEIPAAFRCCAD